MRYVDNSLCFSAVVRSCHQNQFIWWSQCTRLLLTFEPLKFTILCYVWI